MRVQAGHQPQVRVWDLARMTPLSELAGHRFEVKTVRFSPNGRWLVSVGSQYDLMIYVWDWRSRTQLASNRVTSKIAAVSFSPDSSFFVTVGVRHVRFWTLQSQVHTLNHSHTDCAVLTHCTLTHTPAPRPFRYLAEILCDYEMLCD